MADGVPPSAEVSQETMNLAFKALEVGAQALRTNSRDTTPFVLASVDRELRVTRFFVGSPSEARARAHAHAAGLPLGSRDAAVVVVRDVLVLKRRRTEALIATAMDGAGGRIVLAQQLVATAWGDLEAIAGPIVLPGRGGADAPIG